jgi:hypothetical protein
MTSVSPDVAPSPSAPTAIRERREPAVHRPALDSTRAFAVMGVVVYHLRDGLSGGFLGVDTFFVLSGYLITSLLLGEHGLTGRINLARLWTRRTRRAAAGRAGARRRRGLGHTSTTGEYACSLLGGPTS